MKSFDLVSDIHMDHWVSPRQYPYVVMEEITRSRVYELLPESPSEVLVIAGDLGHFNEQNQIFLETLKEHYEYILIVRGNHDLYLVREFRDVFSTSEDRWEDMKQKVAHLEGVHFLEGDTITINNVTFGGTGMWYDLQYGIQVLKKPKPQMDFLWRITMNDKNYIKGIPSFEEEYAKLEKLLNNSLDVVITHVGPDWIHAKNEYARGVNKSFYFFDGQALLDRAQGKIWCFGHTHEHYSYTFKGCRLENNAVGYPNGGLNTKIRTIHL